MVMLPGVPAAGHPKTLLANRLADRAILFGKPIVPVLFAWTILAIAQILALVIFNVTLGARLVRKYLTAYLAGEEERRVNLHKKVASA
jgi:hypothetical protein